MHILASSRNLSANSGPFAVGIGIFDGVHRGHQTLLERVHTLAEGEGMESLAYTFDPHPLRVLGSAAAPQLIEPVQTRLERFDLLGIKAALVERFDREFAATPAEAFIDDILVGRLNARHVVVGHGFAFGAGQRGTTELLVSRGKARGFTAHVVEPVLVGGSEVSSTRVREQVRSGNLRAATELLGRPFTMVGMVKRGAMRGRSLGFGTANLQPENELCPAHGVYACTATIPDGEFAAVTNVGVAPTFGATGLKIEAHLLDYDGHELYGMPMTVQFIDKLRDEQKFDGVEALKKQIKKDVDAARQILSHG